MIHTGQRLEWQKANNTMNFEETMNYIGYTMQFGSVLGLENIRELMKRLGNPQDKIKIVHVAGTNGKGSVIAYLSSILMEAGYKVGRYISPAVFEYLERMQINGINISKNDFADIMTKVKKCADEMVADGNVQPTAFEVETAAAYLYFYTNGCDVAVIETGLGGKEDATNVIQSPVACVITSISLDHTQILGDTISKIASQKAGIIMKNSKVIMLNQAPQAVDAIKEACAHTESDLFLTCKAEDIIYTEGKSSFSYDLQRYDTKMLGAYQIDNAITAIEAAHVIGISSFNISERNIYDGINNAAWNGRFEKINVKPVMYIDGAHNEDAAVRFIQTLDEYFSDIPKVFIFGMLADKACDRVASITAPYAEKIITITPDNPRAMDGKQLEKLVSGYNGSVEYIDKYEEAVKLAFKYAKKIKGMVIAFGSLSYLGEIKNIVGGTKK